MANASRPAMCANPRCLTVGRTTRGLCDRHYQALRRAGKLAPRPERACKEEGCTRPYRARGYCKIHYRDIWWVVEHEGRDTQVCPACSQPFSPNPTRGKSRPAKFCSQTCRGAAYSGDQHWNWSYGEVDERFRVRRSRQYKAWRLAVFTRDKATCQGCGDIAGPFHVDHIKPFATHPDLRFELANGRTLCIPCHIATPTYGGRTRVNR